MMIDSPSNPRVRDWRRIARETSARRREGAVWVEGARFVEAALEAGCALKALLHLPDKRPAAFLKKHALPMEQVFEVSERVMKHCSTTDSIPPVAAVVAAPPLTDEVPSHGRWAVLCGLQDPGNVGAAIRCVQAAGWEGVALDEGCADPLSPKVIRASAGGVFHVPLRRTDTAALKEWREAGAVLAATDSHQGSGDLRRFAGAPFTALVFGAEGQGLPPEILALCQERVKIPMARGCESLNVAAACAVLLFAWGRWNLDVPPENS